MLGPLFACCRVSRHAHPESKKRHEVLVNAAKAMSLARIRIEGRPREEKGTDKGALRVLCAGDSTRQAVVSYTYVAILVLSLLRPHRSRAPWRLSAPLFIACQEECVGYQWLPCQ